jgi:hypothetical protein
MKLSLHRHRRIRFSPDATKSFVAAFARRLQGASAVMSLMVAAIIVTGRQSTGQRPK